MKLARAKLVVILLTVAGLALSVGVSTFLFLPTFKEVQGLSGDIIRAHSELEAQYLNRKNLLTSSGKVETSRGTIRTLSAQFLPAGHELDFITAVEGIAGKNGVEERILLNVNEGAKAAEELHVGFDITLSGDAPAVLQTIVELERMQTLLIFDSAVLRPGEGAPGAPSFLSVNLRGSIVAPPAGI
ncbi:MAG TPA: hypothetical protein VL283_01090 [Candidatus Baltobacteraceae bacterium]|nr:hypothetical protein [Candidatus Baltobacteraceae bacterium]